MIWNYSKNFQQWNQYFQAAFDLAADLWEVSADDLKARDRRELIVKMRTVLIKILVDRNLTHHWVAQKFKRHHTSIAYNLKLHDQFLEIDPEYAENYKAASAKFREICEERDLKR